jgi:hypothetical protein
MACASDPWLGRRTSGLQRLGQIKFLGCVSARRACWIGLGWIWGLISGAGSMACASDPWLGRHKTTNSHYIFKFRPISLNWSTVGTLLHSSHRCNTLSQRTNLLSMDLWRLANDLWPWDRFGHDMVNGPAWNRPNFFLAAVAWEFRIIGYR